jgi:hypothetical protein
MRIGVIIRDHVVEVAPNQRSLTRLLHMAATIFTRDLGLENVLLDGNALFDK